MVDQIKTLLWLKWRLFVNTLNLEKTLAIIGTVILNLLVLLLALGVTVGLFFFGMHLKEDFSFTVLFGCDVFLMVILFGWVSRVVREIQRSDVIDFRKMMFLPVSLKIIFCMNVLWSFISPVAVLFFLPALGFILGLSMKFGPTALLGVLLAAACYSMLASWIYCLRGLLAMLMQNKRRRRLVLVGLPFAMLLLLQAPNLLNLLLPRSVLRSFAHSVGGSIEDYIILANKIIPLGWLPYGLHSLLKGCFGSAALCLFGMAVLGGLALRVGYSSTKGYYTGESKRKLKRRPEKKARAKGKGKGKENLIKQSIPFIGEDTASLVFAEFLTYFRHPRVRIHTVMALVFPFIIAAPFIFRGRASGAGVSSGFLLPMMFVFPMFQFSMFLFSVFGSSHREFQRLILLPTERNKYLLAKNLAIFPFVAVAYFLIIVFGIFALRLPSLTVVVALLQVVQLYLMFCMVGNFSSVYLPYPVKMDTMRNTGRKGKTSTIGFLLIFILPFIMLPTAICFFADTFMTKAFGYGGIPLGPILSIAFLVGTFFIYRWSLIWCGEILLKRETKILEKLSEEKE